MKLNHTFVALAGVLFVYACKKEDKTVTVTETIHDTIVNTIPLNTAVNADELTAGIAVGYGTKVSDATFPAPTADGPVLDTSYHKLYQVVEGNYLVIYPPNFSGYVAGYYVQIAGAKSYFKIDYTKAKGLRKASNNGARNYATATGYVDSTIVIKIPLAVTGNYFNLVYAAYDSLNRVSLPVTTTVTIMPQGSAAFNDSLNGTWSYASFRYYGDGYNNYVWTDDTLSSYSLKYYTCNNGKLVESAGKTDLQLTYYGFVEHKDLIFSGYSYSEVSTSFYRTLDLVNSSCSSYTYTYTPSYGGTQNGLISYDASTRKLTMITNASSNFAFEYYTYQIISLTDHQLILGYNIYDEASDAQYLYLYQYVK